MPTIKNSRQSSFPFLFSVVLLTIFSITFGTIHSLANLRNEQTTPENKFSLLKLPNKQIFSGFKITAPSNFSIDALLDENGTVQKSETVGNAAESIAAAFEPESAFVVNSTADAPDANTADTVCATAANVCTLRAAIEQANASASNDVITFAPDVKIITLTLGTEIVINNAGTLQINGSDTNVVTISANNLSRIFRTELATVTFKYLTLTTGKAPSGNLGGGAVYVNGGAATFDRVHISQSTAGNNATTESAPGGGVSFNGGIHIILNSTFSGNRAFQNGGAIYNNNGALTITDSTFSGNSGYYFGGAIYNSGNLTLRSVTISNNTVNTQCASPNSCTGSGGGIAQAAGALNIGNTIVAGNLSLRIGEAVPVGPPEIAFVSGTIVSVGGNLIGDSANDSINTQNPITYQSNDIRDTPPMLAPLGLYGGTTPTLALLQGSPAINAGTNSIAPTVDQRGAARIVGGIVDIGAFEANVAVSPSSLPNAVNGEFYSQTLTASESGNPGPFAFSLVGSALPAGLTLAANGTLSGTPTVVGTFTFTVKAVDTDGMAGLIQYTLVIGCSYAINPTSQSFTSSGGNGTVNVTTGNGCSWTAQSNVEWITVTAGATGSGNGTVAYTVAANTGVQRTGTIMIAGKMFTVTQASGCTYSLSPTAANLLSGDGTYTFTISSGSGCAYNAVSNSPFITITAGGSGTGSGTITYSVTANTGATRSGTITVGGQTFTVNQAAIPTLSINNVSSKEGDGGTTAFNFTVTLSGASNQTVTVSYATANGTATAPGDFRAAAGTVSFAPGETSKTITVIVNGDTMIEADETFTVTLSSAVNANIAGAQGVGTIQNDDAPADFDTSFDGDGIAVTAAAIYPGEGNTIATQSTGKIIVVGRCCNTSNDSFAAVRYNADGSLDTTFDGDGIFLLQVGPGFEIANAVAVQTDDKIVLVGRTENAFVAVRLNSDGSLDNGFDGDGIVTVDFGVSDSANAVVIQPDGKILIGGTTQPAANAPNDFALARLNPNGSLDASFDADGKVITAVRTGNSDFIKGLALQPDGKIIAVGYTQDSNGASGAIARYNSDGTLDASFGNKGILFDYARTLNSAAIQADGKIIALGVEDSGANSGFVLFRFLPDGTLDSSFDTDGKVSTSFLQSADAKSVLIQTDQKIVATGLTYVYTSNGLNLNLAVARYNPNGSLDASFDADGKLTVSLGAKLSFYGGAGALQTDGKIITVANSAATNSLYVARFKGNFVSLQCEYALSPLSQAFSSGGGTGSTTITTAFGCPWTARSNALWISFPGASSGTRTDTIVFSVAPNPGPARTGTFTAGGQTFTVTQAAAPILTIDSVTLSEGNSGTTAFNFTVSLSGPSSQTVTVYYAADDLTASSVTDYQFISDLISFAPGETSKIVTIFVNGDTKPEADETFKVSLYGSVNAAVGNSAGIGTILDDDTCTYSLSPAGVSVGATAISGNTITVTTQAGCAYTATSGNSWISVTTSGVLSGNSTVTYSVAANPGLARSGTISIAGRIFTIDQAGGKSRKRTRFL